MQPSINRALEIHLEYCVQCSYRWQLITIPNSKLIQVKDRETDQIVNYNCILASFIAMLQEKNITSVQSSGTGQQIRSYLAVGMGLEVLRFIYRYSKYNTVSLLLQIC